VPAESVPWNGVWDGWHLVIRAAAPEAGRVLRLLEVESACQQRLITVFSAALDAKAKTNEAATAFVKFIS
jgi:hypothetical protein